MYWTFSGVPKVGAETASDACDYFVDETVTPTNMSLNSDSINSFEELELRRSKHKDLRQAVLSGKENEVVSILKKLNEHEKSIIVNMALEQENTLIYIASQFGYENIVKYLIQDGADGRVNNRTKYSPLYAAITNGHYKITALLLEAFPELIKQPTVEQWLPLHAACINGHDDLVELIINYNYPDHIYTVFRDSEGIWEWKLPFDPNGQDVTGQSSLYIASISGKVSLVNLLLNWRVQIYKTNAVSPTDNILQARRNISPGIRKLISNLTEDKGIYSANEVPTKCPISLNLLCGAAKETALLAAVRGGFVDVVSSLLEHGADPNIAAKPVENSNDFGEEIFGLCNVPLAEACKQKSEDLIKVLLHYGARDDQGTALRTTLVGGDEVILGTLLSKRVHPDSDYQINTKWLPAKIKTNYSKFTLNEKSKGLIPTIVDWHSSHHVQLPHIKMEWIRDCVLTLNPHLKKNPKVDSISLTAITRIDISQNSISCLPIEIFSLTSLKYLNVAQNKLEEIPVSNEIPCYNCPVLEEIYLQDNKLTAIPPGIFQLVSLLVLDVSNNKLQEMPFEMWKAPKLRELNIAFNLLKNLPSSPNEGKKDQKLFFPTIDAALEDFETLISANSNSKPLHSKTLKHCNAWSQLLDINDRDIHWNFENNDKDSKVSSLSALNLSNNLFTSVPIVLPCLANNLTRLNMSYNNLRSMGHITGFPATIKQLDLSHNEITCWPSLPQICDSDPHLQCYEEESTKEPEEMTPGKRYSSLRSNVLKNVCRHRKHLRLETLKTLILADNLLTKIQLCTDDSSSGSQSDFNFGNTTKSRLMFPNLSMLDISNNCLKEIPINIYELSSLSVLNISGNVDVNDLPPHLGLLSRLWNLNLRGCSLQEPLKTMVENKKYKTMNIVGYLKSIYEDAQPYARMKLMVVGVHGIGKTTLLNVLKHGNSKRPNSNSDHWTKRVRPKGNYTKSSKPINISTVGVDIGTWVCEKKMKDSYGPVIFRTWDFGGQKEYYATHQYFLSKRSLYLVLWKITDGQKGLKEVLQWLGNIQTRACNSPVVIVGTHLDEVGKTFPIAKAQELQRIIKEKFIAIPDAEKVGLPRVIDSIQISCKTLQNILQLSNLIYDSAFSLRSPGSKEPLLLQRIPATYIALEDAINIIVNKLKISGRDPVLCAETYKELVKDEMQLNGHKGFRDSAELDQATMFLHDNGVILHYDDVTLRDFYFVDPQWLCDLLAHVVTVREINPFARDGVMKLNDLDVLLKYDDSKTNERKKYIISLLNKFEVALSWDSKTLIIPSLLPEYQTSMKKTVIQVPRKFKTTDLSAVMCDNLILLSSKPVPDPSEIRRILLMTYFPSGFWPRLITRILSDEQIANAVLNILQIKTGFKNMNNLLQYFVEENLQWNLWQRGIALCLSNIVLFQIKEVPFNSRSIYRNRCNKFKLKAEGVWNEVNINNSNILEIYFSLKSIDLYQTLNDTTIFAGKYDVQFTVASKLLAMLSDHIDILLEDWYPSLGTRFVHTSEGRFLITRLTLCPECFKKLEQQTASADCEENVEFKTENIDNCLPVLKDELDEYFQSIIFDGGSNSSSPADHSGALEIICFAWMIEECIFSAYNKSKVSCPEHFECDFKYIAPDVVFMDISEDLLIKQEDIIRGELLGRGAFGFVFKAIANVRKTQSFGSVAMKMLQPIPPGPGARDSALMAYKISLGKWDRDPLQHSCKAYCIARQELAVLLTLKHLNIVQLKGICVKPLALILEFAPLGALDGILRQYKRSGARISPYTFQLMTLQTARAIEYLHRKKIIYRDLKSENILVFEFPLPHTDSISKNKVLLKIADYGISRITTHCGSKGFGGTEGFMAPEIIRFNGEEEYTEKVDCFSFGMFLYECITLRQPFEGCESIKECILEGNRPPLSLRESQVPTYCLDLMVHCWNDLPRKRPSASQIVSIINAPEFIHLLDAVSLSNTHKINVISGVFVDTKEGQEQYPGLQLWLASNNCKIEVLSMPKDFRFQEHQNVIISKEPPDISCRSNLSDSIKPDFVCCCLVEDNIWVGDSFGNLRAYSSSSYELIFFYTFDTQTKSSIIMLIYLAEIQRVIVGLQNGRIFFIDSTCVPFNYTFAEGSFVLTEIFSSDILISACALCNGSEYELWCGNNSSIINIFPFNKSGVTSHLSVNHFSTNPLTRNHYEVFKMVSAKKYIFSCLKKGSIVYQWNVCDKVIQGKLDCSKLLPCSESLKSISIEDHLGSSHSQITAIKTTEKVLYVGTAAGCLIIADMESLCPLKVFRPHEKKVKDIIIVQEENKPLLATIGIGYRPLLTRFMDYDSTFLEQENNLKHLYCLLWHGENWT
ncbi:leucine-rich repeat serine/threonine-protein kinase 1 [Condylostylus longicornis]|uniref:leucine-rich repeat serine/threonine-protein kinase 1 n=1 Tax=Condylostylus longicornis TaxID=2530218 RepID=UPI00244DC9D5|nr:leucine-rich repeat serine/threonine-protein kinase 1 [Condylostylus longicornis]